MKKIISVVCLLFPLSISAPLFADDTSLQPDPFSISVYGLYGWYYQELVVAKGKMNAQYIQGIADFKTDEYEGGVGGSMRLFGSKLNASYAGTKKYSFNDPVHRALSVTLDAKLFSLPIESKNAIPDTGQDYEIHARYKHNRVNEQKSFGSYSVFKDVTQDYYSNWYNAALVYYYHMYSKTSGPYLDGGFWGGVSTGGYHYKSGIDWKDMSDNPHRYELYLKSDNPYPGINIGFDTTFAQSYKEGALLNFGIDSVFVYYSTVESSVAGKDHLLMVIIEMYGSLEYRKGYFSVSLSGARVLNQSVAQKSNHEGITFIEVSKNIQGRLTLAF